MQRPLQGSAPQPGRQSATLEWLEEFNEFFGTLVAAAGDWLRLCVTFVRLLQRMRVKFSRLDFLDKDRNSFTTFDDLACVLEKDSGADDNLELTSRPLRGSNWSVARVVEKSAFVVGRLPGREVPDDYRILGEKFGYVCFLSVPIMKERRVIGAVTLADTESNLFRSKAFQLHLDVLVSWFGSLLPGGLLGELCKCLYEVQHHRELEFAVRSSLEFFWNKYPMVGVKLALFGCSKRVATVFGMREGDDGEPAFKAEDGAFELTQRTAAGRLLYNTREFIVDCKQSLKDIRLVERSHQETRTVMVLPMVNKSTTESSQTSVGGGGDGLGGFTLGLSGGGGGGPGPSTSTPSFNPGGITIGLDIDPMSGSGGEAGGGGLLMGSRSSTSAWERLHGAMYLAGPKTGIFDSCRGEVMSCFKLISSKLGERLAGDLRSPLQNRINRASQGIRSREGGETYQRTVVNEVTHLLSLRKMNRSGQLMRKLRVWRCEGEGAYGLVFEGRYQGSRAAIKIFSAPTNEKAAKKIGTEIALIATVSNANIVPTYTHFLDVSYGSILALAAPDRHPGWKPPRVPSTGGRTSGRPSGRLSPDQLELSTKLSEKWNKLPLSKTRWNVLVMQYCDKGTLEAEILKRISAFRPQNGHISYISLVSTACDIAHALSDLHFQGIIHGDLKPGNILLHSAGDDCRGFTAKVADFGTSRILGTDDQQFTVQGTIAYMPPEVIGGRSGYRVSTSLDVYSFGIILWEMQSGCKPYHDMSTSEIISGVCRTGELQLRPVFENNCMRRYRELAQLCWQHEETKRPTFDYITQRLDSMKRDLGGG
ncbi:hypothetical protein BSKO_05096 [Bryopsis sp. KO-2023]|nr:hypothetical protein BSKO_05096 [Bryopsis sp. KO-2023]